MYICIKFSKNLWKFKWVDGKIIQSWLSIFYPKNKKKPIYLDFEWKIVSLDDKMQIKLYKTLAPLFTHTFIYLSNDIRLPLSSYPSLEKSYKFSKSIINTRQINIIRRSISTTIRKCKILITFVWAWMYIH